MINENQQMMHLQAGEGEKMELEQELGGCVQAQSDLEDWDLELES